MNFFTKAFKYFLSIFIIFKVANFSIKNNESYYESLKKPKFNVNNLILPFIWLLVNLFSNIAIFSYVKYRRTYYWSHKIQLLTQCLWYVSFFKQQNLLMASIFKLFQGIFIMLSVSAFNKKLVRFLFFVHLWWIVYEMYMTLGCYIINKTKIYKG